MNSGPQRKWHVRHASGEDQKLLLPGMLGNGPCFLWHPATPDSQDQDGGAPWSTEASTVISEPRKPRPVEG